VACILVIEDDEMSRDVLVRWLTRRGHRVLAAVSAEEGLLLAAAEQPELVIMDLRLPGIDGWEATRRLKADPATRAIPVLALTAYALEGERQRALEAGCDDYDTKPVDFARFKAKIDALLA
jgi:CheY-like chemotaxis protein